MSDETTQDQAVTDSKPTTKKTTKKKVAKKAVSKKKVAKKTTKKASTTKKTAKKTTKKAAAKKTAKKTAKKKATKKKASKKAAVKKKAATTDEPAEPDEAEDTESRAQAMELFEESATDDDTSEEAGEADAVEPQDADADDDDAQEADPDAEASDDEAEDEPRTKKTARTRKRRRSRSKSSDSEGEGEPADQQTEEQSGQRSDQKGRQQTRQKAPKGPKVEMLINYVPGEDCRIAVVEDGRLEEFYSEPTSQVSRVGNIYVGRVTNVETQIQAAFVDFGLEEAGFLHVSDLHPRYFPGDADATEKVGRKTPRRQRPPIQQCLRKGQEIIVQVLKEGVGTKGPSLTSYLSIPGRFLVMMPDMDKVGVSRKVEDETERRKMREILDQLDLPDGFGFILRTAGYDRTKEDLDRDLSYLRRLWADMQDRRSKGGGPRLLYSESDLLVRTLRDQLTSDVSRLVIDSKYALERSAAFLKIVSPGSGTKLEHFEGQTPIFHAFGIEDQIALMHATEVPLPSGGRLVIEQTEALVAIDVNSGRSRGAKDAEANALNTNLEAVDEICRQLRLRDLGGLVINDLIDMRPAANRRRVENLFRERLKRDRAKSTVLPISEFGILEMTRQRMRGSYEQQHFQTCPSCSGRGLVQRPDSVAADALRELASLLDHERVAKIELVVSPRVAGALLSTRRAGLGRIERATGKLVDVRISESISSGRVAFYAYDANGADLDIGRLPKRTRKPQTIRWVDTDEGKAWAVDAEAEAEKTREKEADAAAAHDEKKRAELADIPLPGENEPKDDSDESGDGKKKKRRRRRRGKKRRDDGSEGSESDNPNDSHADSQAEAESPDEASSEMGESESQPHAESHDDADESQTETRSDDTSEDGEGKKKRRRRRRRRRRSDDDSSEAQSGDAEHSGSDHSDGEKPERERSDREAPESGSDDSESGSGGRKRRRSRRGGKSSSEQPAPEQPQQSSGKGSDDGSGEGEDKPKRRRRGLYGAGRRTLSPSEKARLGKE